MQQTIMSSPQTVTTMDGEEIPLRMPVEYTSFSAHSDYAQTSEFIKDTKSVSKLLALPQMSFFWQTYL
jgi:Cft2 family RNA processing exonuclease